MPRFTQYIREEDLGAWRAIENKSEWIHDHLGGGVQAISPQPTIIRSPDEIPVLVKKRVSGRVCKHGNPVGQCFDKQSDRSCKS